MIRIDLADMAAADRLVEALYVAAGQRPGTVQADAWYGLAADLEAGIDALPARHPCCPDCQVEPGVPCHHDGRPLHGAIHNQRTAEAERTLA